MNLETLQDAIGYRFLNRALLEEALTHRSFGTPHNERLEFLGDSVLNCAVSSVLFNEFPGADEGELSRRKAHHVRQDSLHSAAQRIDLGRFLRLGAGEMKTGGYSRPSTLADALEAVIGAVYLDGGFGKAMLVIEKLLRESLESRSTLAPVKDAKTKLQEMLQARHVELPKYSIRATKGAAHDRRFEVECFIETLAIRTFGQGSSKRSAEQAAAQCAIEKLPGGQ
jgi:ribonuclease III